MKQHVLDHIEFYPDSTELICESVANAYSEAGVKDRHAKADAIREAIVTGDDAEAGRILRELVYRQAYLWINGD